MAIDIRANVTCSLGTLISGSISDDYIQGNGLVKTKGQCELQGIHTPTAGTEVTFSYTRGGTTHQIPRRLRVLSSFADPFRNITKVELGCKLTYLQGVGPAPTVDGRSSKTSGRQQQCLNGWTDYDANSLVPYPVSASALMDTCLARLSLTASSNPLTNRFFVDKFDFSQGYVPVLGDLLVSESYFGYLDENEVLQVRDLAVEGGGGPVIDSTTLIDLDQVGVGDLPGDAVVVRYDALKLKKPIDTTDTAEQRRRDWEEEEILGEPESHVVRHTNTNGDVVENTYTYIPYQRTVTTYGPDDSFDPTVCILSGREGADLSDSPIKAESTERILMAQAATNYCSELLSAGVSIDPAQVDEFKTKEIEYKYDGKGELIETIEYTFEPFYKWAGGLDLQFVYQTDTGSSHVLLGSGSVLVQKVITTRENVYAPTLAGTYIKAGEELVPVVEAQKVKTETYTNWALTQQGQQAVAQIKDQTPFTTAQQCLDWLNANSTALVLSDGQVQINRGRDIVQGQKRAKSNERTGSENGDRPEVSGQLIYASGSRGVQRTISMSMPYQSDDYFTKTGAINRGNAAGKALRYGRSQNRLLMGNRYGVSIQIHPDRMPAHPYDPLYLSNGSMMVQYRANAANWAFSRDGVVASLDALYWGVAGGTGTSWAPVAPGITTFPPLPTVDADGNTDVDSVVPPWNETIPMAGVTRTTVDVAAYDYSIAPLTDAAALVTRTKLTVGSRMAADAGAFTVTGIPLITKLFASAGTFTVDGKPAGSRQHRIRRSDVGTFVVTGQPAAKFRTYGDLRAEAATFDLDGMPAGKFTGKTLKAEGSTFTLTGMDAGLAAERKLAGEAATFTLSGMDATLKKKVIDPDGAHVALLLHMDGADGSTAFPDSSTHSHTVTVHGSTAITTTEHPSFLTSSAEFNGSTDYLEVPHDTTFDFGTNAWTVEAWIYMNTKHSGWICDIAPGSNRYLSFGYNTLNNGWSFYTSSGSVQASVISDSTPEGAWHHIAMSFDGATVWCYKDGVYGASHVQTSIAANTSPVIIGAYSNATQRFLNGYLADFRITNGVARYTGTGGFTPPTAQLPDP